MNTGPCAPWPFVLCCDLNEVSPAITGHALNAATEVLWGLSGRQFGSCPVTLRPCRDECDNPWRYGTPQWGASWPYPALIGGAWYNLGCGGSCTDGCSCNTESQFVLPSGQMSITQITIDGTPLASGAYVVESGIYVRRIDGGEWPRCNDGTWLVDVTYGAEVPSLGQMAVGELMCQFAKACAGQDCKLPTRVQSIVRQGVTMSFLDPQEFLTDGRIGLYLSDLFIQSVNPEHLASPPSIANPDRPPPRWTN